MKYGVIVLMLASSVTVLHGQAVSNKAYLWPNGIVPYEISSQYSEMSLLVLINLILQKLIDS